jgi:sugar phosphate isomerase/epimerase
MDRKSFLKTSALLGTGTGSRLSPDRLPTIGLGLFSIPKLLENNLEEGVRLMAEIGIREFETYGPYSFTDERTKASWSALTSQLGFSGSGFFRRSVGEFKDLLDSYGIRVPSMHTDLFTLETNMSALADAARRLGARYVVLPAIPESERTDREAYRRMAERFNEIGRQAREEGVRFAYHNHGYGLVPETDGVVPLDLLLRGTDPDTVFLEMDLFWTVAGHADPLALLDAHPGRYRMLHIKDMRTITRFKGSGSTPAEWMELFPLLVPAGEGEIPLEEILSAAYHAGVEHYFIEHDFAPDPKQNIRSACDYLRGLDL